MGLQAVRLAAAAARPGQGAGSGGPGGLGKEGMLELAAERNRVRLPDVVGDLRFGVRLPHERFVLTGVGWGVLEGSEVEDEVDENEAKREVDVDMGGLEGINGGGDAEREDEDMGDEGGDDGFEHMFGSGETGGEDESSGDKGGGNG